MNTPESQTDPWDRNSGRIANGWQKYGFLYINTSHRLQNRSLAGVVKTEGSLKTFISALDVCVCIFLYLSRLLSEHLFHAYTEKVIDRTKVFAEFNYTPESKNYQLEKNPI